MTMQPSMEERARGIEIRECIGIVAYIVPSAAAANKPASFLGIMRLGSLNLLHYNIFVSLMSPPSFFSFSLSLIGSNEKPMQQLIG